MYASATIYNVLLFTKFYYDNMYTHESSVHALHLAILICIDLHNTLHSLRCAPDSVSTCTAALRVRKEEIYNFV